VLIQEKTDWRRKASLYPVFPVNWYIWYQAMGAASRDVEKFCYLLFLFIICCFRWFPLLRICHGMMGPLTGPPRLGTKGTDLPETLDTNSHFLVNQSCLVINPPSRSWLKGKFKHYKLALASSYRHPDHASDKKKERTCGWVYLESPSWAAAKGL